MVKAGFVVLWLAIASMLGAEPLSGDHWTVPVQGLYRIDAEGSGDASLSIVARAAGPVGGLVLAHDLQTWKGSTMLMLEPGDYELRWTKNPGVTVKAQVQAFRPVNAASIDQAPELKDGDSTRTNLTDGQSLMWKVVVPPGQTHLNLEIRGRNLSQVVLWKDGVWDQDIRFTSARLMPVPGRPYQFYELDRELEPGSYVLVAFGAPRVDWGDSKGADPFWISRGRAAMALGAVREGKLDDEGRAEYWVQSGVSTLQAEFPEAVDATLASGPQRLNAGGASLAAKEPVRLLQINGYGARWAVLQGPPGARFRLRALTSAQLVTSLPYADQGVLIATSASAQESDGLPLTVVAVAGGQGGNPQLLLDHSLAVDDDHPLHLSFDAQTASSVFIRVNIAGSYTITENSDKPGVCEYRFDLIDDMIRNRNTPPLLVRNGQPVLLQAKIYRISTSALKLGRCEWALAKTGQSLGPKAPLWTKPLSGGGQWTAVVPSLARNAWPVLYISSRGSVPASVAVLSLPLDAENLPALALDPGQTVRIPVTFSDGTWRGWTSESVSVDGQPLAPGGATTNRQNSSMVTVTSPQGGIFETQTGLPPPGPLPPLPQKIPVGQVFWEDWDRNQTRVYELEVTKPGMYSYETFGRLSCEIRVRSPLHRDLFTASRNGGGTNALLSTYLAPGLYRVEMRVVDQTAGRAGLILTAADDPVERTLVAGLQARATVPAQQFLKVNVNVGSDGRYLLTSLGLNQDFIRRFEDSQGYPVAAPLERGSLTSNLSAGRYTIWSYPLEADSRRAYGLELLDTRSTADDQPGRLAWNRPRQAKWEETPSRTPQVYSVTAEAPLRAQILLTEGMVWQLLAPSGKILDQGPGGRPIEISIPQGESRLAVRSQAVDNLKDYSVELVTLDLTPGRSIVLPEETDVPLVVGHKGTYELITWGTREVTLSLTKEDGSVLSRGVARTDDWNTSMTVTLAPGRYRAQIRTITAANAGPTRVQPVNEERDEDSQDSQEETDDVSDDSNSGSNTDADDDAPPPAPRAAPRSYAGSWSPWQEARYPGDNDAAPLLMFRERVEKQAAAIVGEGGGSEVWNSSIVSRSFTTKAAGVYRFSSDAGQLATFRLVREGRIVAQSAGGFLIPLQAKTTYQLSNWWEDGTSRPVTLSVAPVDVATWNNAAHLSGRVPGSVLASSAWEEPLVPAPDGWLTPKDAVWWTGDDTTVTPVPVSLGSGDSVSVPMGQYGQAVKLTVPAGSVGLLQAHGNGSAVGLSVQPTLTFSWNWRQALVTDRTSLAGVGPGEYVGRLWDPAGGAARWADLSWNTYPAPPTTDTSGTLNPGTAVLVRAPGGALKFVLDAGLIAFPLSGDRPLTADSGPVSSVLGGKSWAVVNPTGRAALWRADPASADDEPVVTDDTPWERDLPQAADLTVNVQGTSGSHVYVSLGGVDEVRWGDSVSGRWETPKRTVLATGEWLEWPRSRGTLFLKGVTGWIRVVSADAPPATAAALGFSGKAVLLPAEGGVMAASQQWTFRAPKTGFYAVSAPGGGVLGVWQGGTPISSSWSSDRRLVLVKLTAGIAVVAARSFGGAVPAGSVTVRPLSSQTGEALLSPGEAQLWPVIVQAPGRVGLALNADSEEPRLWLFSPDFRVLGQGRLFWRSLSPGTYWMVVEGGEHTVRYRPVLLGLEGSRLGVPDDVRAQFQQDPSLSQGQSE